MTPVTFEDAAREFAQRHALSVPEAFDVLKQMRVVIEAQPAEAERHRLAQAVDAADQWVAHARSRGLMLLPVDPHAVARLLSA